MQLLHFYCFGTTNTKARLLHPLHFKFQRRAAEQ